jgi:hypothetical protein
MMLVSFITANLLFSDDDDKKSFVGLSFFQCKNKNKNGFLYVPGLPSNMWRERLRAYIFYMFNSH